MGIVSRLLESINGIYWFPILAFVIFVIFFILVTVHTLTMKKNKEKECGSLPFDNEETPSTHEM